MSLNLYFWAGLIVVLAYTVQRTRSSSSIPTQAAGVGRPRLLANCTSQIVFNHTGCTAGGNYNESHQVCAWTRMRHVLFFVHPTSHVFTLPLM